MSSGRGFFGEFAPIVYENKSDVCGHGLSSVSPGCGLPATRFFERTGPNNGPVPTARHEGRCAAHAEHLSSNPGFREVSPEAGAHRCAEIRF